VDHGNSLSTSAENGQGPAAGLHAAIFAEWERGDATALTWIIPFPDELLTYLAQGFAELKAEQGKLLGASAV